MGQAIVVNPYQNMSYLSIKSGITLILSTRRREILQPLFYIGIGFDNLLSVVLYAKKRQRETMPPAIFFSYTFHLNAGFAFKASLGYALGA